MTTWGPSKGPHADSLCTYVGTTNCILIIYSKLGLNPSVSLKPFPSKQRLLFAQNKLDRPQGTDLGYLNPRWTEKIPFPSPSTAINASQIWSTNSCQDFVNDWSIIKKLTVFLSMENIASLHYDRADELSVGCSFIKPAYKQKVVCIPPYHHLVVSLRARETTSTTSCRW